MEKNTGIKRFFSSWRTVVVLLGIYAAGMAAATFIEAGMGTEAARAAIYHSWWFIALHVLLVACFVAMSLKFDLLRRKRWGTLLLHYGFVVMIAGAFITHVWGYEGYMHIREGESSSSIVEGGATVREVPFTVELRDFRLVRYPGSNTPSSYESDVVITYKGVETPREIYMNNIARVGGFRIYQTSYDSDEGGTVLTVNSDRWGTGVTYAGYIMLFIGLVAGLLQKGSRFRSLYRSLGKSAAVIALLCGLSFSASAQGPAVREIDPGRAERFGRLVIQAADGRVEPVNTYSSEILRKISHRDRFRGMTGDQVLIGLMGDPYGWGDVPLVYVPVPEVARAVGASGEYTSFNSVFDDEGNYRLTDVVSRIYRKEPGERNKTDKEYLKLDEKINILYSLFNGGMMPLFPSADGRWLSPADAAEVGLTGMDSMFVARTLPWYAESMAAGRYAEADEVIAMIEKYQSSQTAGMDVNRGRIDAEIFYNKVGVFRWCFRLYLIVGFLLMLLAASAAGSKSAVRAGKRPSVWITILSAGVLAVFLFQTFGLGLRWYISGRGPWASSYETMVYVGWITVLSGLLFARRSRMALALAAMLGGVVLFVSNLGWLDPQITPLVPVLKSPWLMIHVSVITASYGFFGICAMCGLTSLVAILAGRQLPELRKINELALNIGLVLLTAGIFFGAVWANESWGRYWGWDPKETWALITMVVYAIISHSHFIPRLNNYYAFAAMSLGAISTVLMTFFGVNYYLSGLHSYGGSGEVSFLLVGIASVIVVALIVAAGVKYKKIR